MKQTRIPELACSSIGPMNPCFKMYRLQLGSIGRRGGKYPADLPACPAKNESRVGEVASGEEIPIEGIWEPWFPAGKVGCPNYFLKGSVAHAYLLEGTNDEYDVRWRLLWEDTRYRDGSIPEEESTYFPKSVAQTSLRALPGETCPRTGRWQSPAVKDSVHVEAGEPMPGPQHTSMGHGHLALCGSTTAGLNLSGWSEYGSNREILRT